MTTLPNFLTEYLLSDHCLVAVLMPLSISLVGLRSLFNNGKELAWFVACTFLSYLMARWETTETSMSLYIVPMCLFYIVWSVYLKQEWSSLKAFTWTFLSLFLVDCLKALDLRGEGPFDWFIFYGVGGAGLKDGLVIFPVLISAVIPYAKWRQSGVLPASPLAVT